MSEAFVDVMWRGLEVGKRVKLHAIHAADAYIDHSTPMPVGTVLSLKTDDGLEIAATVTRVHEQVGGSNEVPGMQVKPDLAGAAATWWKARAEAAPPAPVNVAALAAAAVPAGDDPRASIVAKPTLTMSTVEVERALAAVKGTVTDEADASNTEVMAAVDPATLAALADETGDTGDSKLVDDGKRTMVMSAVDVSAIVEQADAESDVTGPMNGGNGGNGHNDEPSVDDPGGSGARGKNKRRGKRNKRNSA
jgi:hypothetical protein